MGQLRLREGGSNPVRATHRLINMTPPSSGDAGSVSVPGPLSAAAVASLAPLFRWPGGKRWLTSQLLELIPDRYGRYFEPFVGAGALFFALRPGLASLSDANHDLMSCYAHVRDNHDQVARLLADMPRNEDSYYRIRSSSPVEGIARAARFIYLATLAFNGIYRVNQRGQFNVPYGGRSYSHLDFGQALAGYAAALSSATLTSGDFEAAVADASTGDVVYLDPPYTVAHANNGFMRYNDHIFSWADQRRLAGLAAELAGRGCILFISNAYHPSVRDLYPSFSSRILTRPSLIAPRRTARRPVHEYLFTNVV